MDKSTCKNKGDSKGGSDNCMKNYQNSREEKIQNIENRSHTEIVMHRNDSTREWLTYISVFVVMMAILSNIHSIGTLFPYLLEEFGENRANTVAIQSVFFGVGLCSGLFSGMIIQHYGPKICGIVGAILFSSGLILSSFATSTTYLLISFGIISGLGGPPFLFLSACQAASQCFEGKTKLIALSVATSSLGVGAMVYPYFIKITTDSFGVKGSLMLLGGIATNAIPLAYLWSNPRYSSISKEIDKKEHVEVQTPLIIQESQTANNTNLYSSNENVLSDNRETCMPSDKEAKRLSEMQYSKGDTNAKFQKTNGKAPGGIFAVFIPTITYKPFFLLVCSFACSMPSRNVFDILLLDVLETSGLTRDRGITLLVILNCVAIPGRMFPGLINKIPKCNSFMALILGTMISGIGFLLLTLTYGFTGAVISCILLGISKGIILGSMSVVPLEMLGSARLSTAMGITSFVVGIFTTAQGPMHGFLRDVSGSYTTSLYIAAGSMLFALMFSSASLLLESRMKAREVFTEV